MQLARRPREVLDAAVWREIADLRAAMRQRRPMKHLRTNRFRGMPFLAPAGILSPVGASGHC